MIDVRDIARVEEPDDIAGVFVSAWNDRDADRLAPVFDDDAEFVNVTGLWWHDLNPSARRTRTAWRASLTLHAPDNRNLSQAAVG
jgi:hypothetical protein